MASNDADGANNNNNNRNIPNDLLIDILVRLPVKSLLRFKSVSKYWYDLIQSPNFIRYHHNCNPFMMLLVLRYVRERDILHNPDPNSLSDKVICDINGFDIVTKDNLHTLAINNNFTPYNNSGDDPYKYIDAIIEGGADGAFRKEFALSIFHDYDIDIRGGRQPPHEDIIDMIETYGHIYHWRTITGPVDGLFLLNNGYGNGVFDNKLALWNPGTTELRILPLPDFYFLNPTNDYQYVFGFGLDLLANDYKVLWIPQTNCCWPPDAIPQPPDVALYSLCTNTWRHFNSILPYVAEISPSDSTYLSGSCYWVSQCVVLVNNSEYMKESRLVAFDMSTDMFREIKIPNSIARLDSIDQCIKLVLHNDNSIALLVYEYIRGGPDFVLDTINMWVMKHEEGCWTKIFTLGLDPHLQLQKPLGFWKDDDNNYHEIFFTTTTHKLVLYNTDTCEIRHLGVQGDHSPYMSHTYLLPIFKYKESLVSFGGPKNCKLNVLVQDFLAFQPPSL